jgi:hypothetical protein
MTLPSKEASRRIDDLVSLQQGRVQIGERKVGVHKAI